jgi:hypothetical protein
MRVCLGFLERSQNYIQLLWCRFSQNLDQFHVVEIIEIIADLKQILTIV